MPGYIKLYREIRHNRIWQEKPFTRGQAWVDMLLRCNHVCVQMPPQYQSIWVLRGQFLSSNIKLGEAWGWGEYKVRRFMDYLVKEGMIRYFPRNKYCVYEITKYAELQASDTNGYELANAEQNTSRKRAKHEQKTTNKNDKNDKNDKDIYKVIFDHWNFKNIIVHRKLTDKIKRKISGTLESHSEEEIKKAIDNYHKVLIGKEYYWTYKWTLEDFLQRGIEKFLTDACFENYSADKKPQQIPQATNFEQRNYDKGYYDKIVSLYND